MSFRNKPVEININTEYHKKAVISIKFYLNTCPIIRTKPYATPCKVDKNLGHQLCCSQTHLHRGHFCSKLYALMVVKVDILVYQFGYSLNGLGLSSVNALVPQQAEKAFHAGIVIRATNC